jgi:riboflavin-specific deaminase-like protein
MTDLHERLVDWLAIQPIPTQRPFVTLAYAQCLDGCISAARGVRTALSGAESLALTHALRAAHDGILIGVGTLITDDPQLTVRHMAGSHPQPIILDSNLNTPRRAKVMGHSRSPWIVTTTMADAGRAQTLMESGARVLRFSTDEQGRPALGAVLGSLHAQGIRRLMVEGGARVITSFLRQRFVDALVVTLAPQLLGGLRAFDPESVPDLPRLCDPQWERAGRDSLFFARTVWSQG